MRDRRLLTLLLPLMVGLPGCTLSDAFYTGVDSLKPARLKASIEVQTPPRFRLDAGSPVTLLSPSAIAPEWLIHAQAGVDRVFPQVEGPGYLLIVNGAWDQAPGLARSRAEGTLGLGGFIEVPGPSETQTLTVQLRDSNGAVVSQHRLTINPALWQADWDAPKVVEQAFYEFALLLAAG